MSNKQNKAKKEEEKNIISQDESKLAKDLLKIIAISNIRLGTRDISKEPEKYKETAIAMIQLLFKKNVKFDEVELLFQLMLQSISIAKNAVMGSLDLSRNMALTELWGKHPDEVTLQDIDSKMKKKKDK